MTRIDWLIVAFMVVMATAGWRQGFVAGALALAGFAGGVFVGSRLGPHLLPDGSSSPYAPLVALVAALIGGAVLSGLLERVGIAARRGLPLPGLSAVDGLLGAVLSLTIAVSVAWLAGAAMLQTPGAGELRGDIQRSTILQRLNDVLPPSGPLLNALARFDPLPRLDLPAAQVAPPTPGVARGPAVRAAAASVVRVLGTACGLGVEGSGWVTSGSLVVTNAHVVAGEDDTVVQERGVGRRLMAVPVAFDAHDDIAVLRVDGLTGVGGLTLSAGTRAGTPGATLGFPGNGPYVVRAARLGPTRQVLSEDAYGHGPVRRSMTAFRGTVRPGNSGGPIVDASGHVLTTVFAQTSARTSTGVRRRGGLGVPNAIVRAALAAAASGRRVSTGPCAR